MIQIACDIRFHDKKFLREIDNNLKKTLKSNGLSSIKLDKFSAQNFLHGLCYYKGDNNFNFSDESIQFILNENIRVIESNMTKFPSYMLN